MRIVYLHYLYGEPLALLHVQQFAEATRQLGHHISVHAMNFAHGFDAAAQGQPTARNWFKDRLSRYLHEPKELLWNPRYLRREVELVRREQPDVLLVRDHLLTCAEVGVRAITGVPLVFELNAPALESDTYFDEYAHIPGAGHWTEHLKLRSADAVVTVSDALRQYVIRTHGLGAERVVANQNGADCDRFRPDVDTRLVRQRHALPDLPVVGMVTSMKPWHGPELIRALVSDLYASNLQMLFVGGGGGWAEFNAWAGQQGFSDRLTIAGAVPHDEVPAYVAAMDIAIMPESNIYGSPLKVIEYMAAGRAVVAPSYGPIAEVITHEEHGLLFPPRDMAAAAACIRRLLADRDLRHRLGQRARERALHELTWRHNAARAVGACEAAIVRRRGRA